MERIEGSWSEDVCLSVCLSNVCSGFLDVRFDAIRNQHYFVSMRAECLVQKIKLHIKVTPKHTEHYDMPRSTGTRGRQTRRQRRRWVWCVCVCVCVCCLCVVCVCVCVWCVCVFVCGVCVCVCVCVWGVVCVL